MIWTKHEAPLGHDIKPYYMQREAEGSLAEHCAMRERVISRGRLVTRWALYDLSPSRYDACRRRIMGRECRLVAHFRTLREAKAHAAPLTGLGKFCP